MTQPAKRPTETAIGNISGFQFARITGAPVVRRRIGGPMDFSRRSFASMLMGRKDSGTLRDFVRQASRTWPGKLPPGFPAALMASAATPPATGHFSARPGPGRPSPFPSIRPQPASASTADLTAGLACQIRAGYVTVRGVPIPGVTLSTRRASLFGAQFIEHEEGPGPTVYWPGGASGVTIGPGYDLTAKSKESVLSDMTSVGVDVASASALAGAVTLRGPDARDWVRAHKNVVRLTVLQQGQLFYKVVPAYETLVALHLGSAMKNRLFEHEFDALLSLAWNTSRYGFYDFNRCVNRCDMVAATPAILTLTAGGRGIPPRRHRETQLLADGIYTSKQMTVRNSDVDFYDDVSGRVKHA